MEHIVFVESTTSGAGFQAVKYAKECGLNVTLLTRNGNKYRGNEEGDITGLIDEEVNIETNDTDQVCQTVLMLHSRMAVTAVTTFSDYYVPQAACAASMLNLPSITYAASLRARNKYLTRLHLRATAPELNPNFIFGPVSDMEELNSAHLTFPLVLKPIDENDSHLVKLVYTADEAMAHAETIKQNDLNRNGKKRLGGILAEEFIGGDEFSVEVYKGGPSEPMVPLGITKKCFSGIDRGYFIEIGHIFPTHEHEDMLNSTAEKTINALGIDRAVCHLEMKVFKNQVKVLEVNPRLAGVLIGSWLIEAATGASAVKLALDCARGLKPEWRPTRKKLVAAYFLESSKSGRLVTDIQIPDNRPQNIIHCGRYSHIGDFIQPPQRGGHLLAYAIAEGDSTEDALNAARDFVSKFRYEVDNY